MKEKFKLMKEKLVEANKKSKTDESGFISLEVLIAAGLMLGIGITGLILFKGTTDTVVDESLDKVATVVDLFQ